MLVLDQRVTTHKVLGELDQRGVKFLTLRMRSPSLVRHINNLPATAWKTITLDRDAKHRKPKVCEEHQVKLTDYPGTVRQLIITGLGRDTPTVIITNDHTTPTKQLIERYARRMTIEQRLAEAIRSFHLDALSSAVPLNVDLDVALSVLASAVCAALRRRLPGYHTATPDTLQRHFLGVSGQIRNHGQVITVRIDRRTHSPVLRAANLTPITVPWWGDRTLRTNSPETGGQFAAWKSALEASGGGQAVDGTRQRHGVQLAGGVDSERGQARHAQPQVALLGDPPAAHPRGPDPAGAVVAVQVGATQAGDAPAPVDAAADHRAGAALAAVLDHRVDRARGALALEVVPALAPVPAVVAAARPGRLVVDLLPGVLADVADPQVAGGGIEGEAPRVAQPVRPDLRAGAAAADERVVGRHAVGAAAGGPRVDAEDLAEQRAQRLPVALGVAAAAAVPQADVQHPVGTEGELAAVVVGEQVMVDLEDRPLRGGLGPAAAHGELGHVDVAATVGEVDVEVAAVGGEGQAQQPLLAALFTSLATSSTGIGST